MVACPPNTNKPIIVIIPGAFHRPSHYAPIIQPLQSLGYRVLSIPLVVSGDSEADLSPTSTPADDAAALQSHLLPLLDAGPPPNQAVLVAHSYGSNVATACIRNQSVPERAARNLRGGIIGVIWIAGFAFPARGKNILGGDERDLPLREHRVLHGSGLVSLTEGAKCQFYNDLMDQSSSSPGDDDGGGGSGSGNAIADEAFASLCRFQSYRSMNTLPEFIESEIDDKKVRKMYVLCERDRTVLPAVQERMARVGGFGEVVRLDSGHAPFLSVPLEVVRVVDGFCRGLVGVE